MIRRGPAATSGSMPQPHEYPPKPRPTAFTSDSVRTIDGAPTCCVVLSQEGQRIYRRRGNAGLRDAAGPWLEEAAGSGATLRVVEALPPAAASPAAAAREPRILAVERNGTGLEAAVEIPQDLAIFTGHFPHVPIVPGAVLVGWVLDLAARNGLWPHRDLHAHAVKFRRIVQPGDRVRFVVAANATASRLDFRIESDAGLRAAGTLLAPPS